MSDLYFLLPAAVIGYLYTANFKSSFVNVTDFKMAALDKMSLECKSTFIRYTNLLDFIGLSLFDSKGLFTKRNAKFFAFAITFFPFVMIQFSLVTKFNSANFMEGAQLIPLSVMFLIDLVKLAILISNRDKIRGLFIEIGEMWPTESQRSAEKTDIMSGILHRNKLINWFFNFAMMDLFAYEIIPLVSTVASILMGNVQYMLPFQVPDCWRIDNFAMYLVVYVYLLITTIPCQMCLYVPTDLVIVIFCSNLSVLFTVLQSDLRNAIQREGRTNRPLYCSDQESYNKIKLAIKTHRQLLRISSEVSGIFGVLLLMHIMSSSVIICFFGFLAIAYGSPFDKMSYMLTVFNAILMVFVLAQAGQLLYDASSRVAEAAYESLWFESDVNVRRTMLFIIIRGQQPANLSALGFSNMTLRTFSKIMSSGWTYFNLLIHIFEDI